MTHQPRERDMNRSHWVLAAALFVAGAGTTSCGVRAADADRQETPQVLLAERLQAKPPRTLSVSGTSTLQVLPDVVDVHMTLQAEKSRPAQAISELRSRREALIPALKSHGLDNADIKVSYLSMNPVYNYKTGQVRAYQASINVTASVRDFDRVGPIMEAGAVAKVTRMHSTFRSTQMSELKKKVRDMALTAAQDKAQQMAAALDVAIGPVQTISENQTGSAWSYRPVVANSMDFAQPQANAVQPSLQPLTLTVNVVYQLD